ncbi:MAG: SusC/RagA family TonB-linked outer membrane protein [Tannerella sp.]|jgi:TonB-linked SusC/RagA family outer membrane protein|nr:SusC/RagA family TonB-linked outer membrane protein [Tannerella sp.]
MMYKKCKKLLFLVLLVISIGTVSAQTSSVAGTVISEEDGQPIIGASVSVKGTQIGTVTDVDGKFTLTNVPSTAKTLQVSFIGMETEEVAIKPILEIVMRTNAQQLDEVLVTVAYGTVKRTSLTGAVSSVSQEQIEMRPVSSVTSALEGTTSGVRINSTYGQPGDDPSIYIRGYNTVNGSSDPLYVIDGVPFGGNISDLNPQDIESISVLKDAASCALYGNRGANGVILITTRKGISSKISFDLKVNQGTYSRGIKEYDRTSARQFMEASWQNLRNVRISDKGETAAAAAEYASKNLISDALYLNIWNKPDDQLFDANGNLVADARILSGYADDLDWYKEAIRDGYRQEYSFSGSGATEKSDYYFSLGYLDEKGYVTNADFDRISARTVLNLNPKRWIKAGITLSGTHQVTNYTSGDSDASYTNAFMYAREIAPIYPVHLHNADGTYRLDAEGNKQYDSGFYTNDEGEGMTTRNQYPDRHVIWENELDLDQTVRNTMQGIAYADIKFLKDFTFTLKGDLNVRNSESASYNSAIIGNGKGNLGRASRTIYRYKNYTFQQLLNWGHAFDKHNVSALIAHENYSYNYNYIYGYKTTEVFAGKPNFSNFTDITSLSGYENNYRTESYLGRVRYNYDDRYNLEVSFRRDGSSRFVKENRWGNFGSIGANWIISREDFMKSADWVKNLKLRANWGQVGNDAGVGYYGYMGLYVGSQNANKGAYYLSQNEALDIQWETGEAFGFAMEGRLFNRWNLSVEYFDKRNKNLLFNVYLPLSAGATSNTAAEATISKNLGTISNKGVEISTDIDLYKDKDWTVNFNANASFIKNKVLTLPEQNRKEGIISGNYKIMEGKSRYEFFLYTFEGVDQLTGNSLYKVDLEKNFIKIGEDVEGNKDGTDITDKVTLINGTYYVNNVTYALKEYHGSALPKVYGSFTGSAAYKAFSLSALFTYSLGGKTYDGVYRSLMLAGSSPSNYHLDIMQSWKAAPEGMTETSADRIKKEGIPQINSTLSSDNNTASSRWLTSSDYLVIKNISLSYQLPKSFVKRLDLEAVGFSATCENLLTFAARQGMNPQQSISGSQYNYLVSPRVFSVGVNIKL